MCLQLCLFTHVSFAMLVTLIGLHRAFETTNYESLKQSYYLCFYLGVKTVDGARLSTGLN